ncbi:hypothetical protein [Methylobacterium brachythecii]|uniref:Methyl-accepting chemotaxis protein n=1 Tax=Methylobacterium brachythecii TaxID=1176177 RepID=A0A7W6F865_9HYPH|nr:hypothetical protein [Methylobacterium brachythecii]MBB3904162.1 methyl-accepting chemotaxis protein [Methylobacterium brachythecii]GLS45176.1 hypothetical protein GCM10007884_31650 [Methylobacterium brachythecii]
MEAALKTLADQGVAGALLVLFLGAIVYLNKKREESSDARLKDTKEQLVVTAETNHTLATLKDAVSGVASSITTISLNMSAMHADNRSALDRMNSRDERIERMIEEIGKSSSATRATVESITKDLDRLLDQPAVPGR